MSVLRDAILRPPSRTRPTLDTITPRGRALAIGLLSVAQFLVALDFSIVNVALPVIQADLGFTARGVQWVVSGYALAFGGFLLVGGRAADIYGRPRMFVIGLAASWLGTIAAAVAGDPGTLIAARAAQGLGAALLVPAAISLIVNICTDDAHRRLAIGRLGALGGLGAASGVLLGGILTEAFGWRMIFWVKLPLVATAIVLTPLLVPRKTRPRSDDRLDVRGALAATAGLLAFMAAIAELERSGTGAVTLAFAAAAAALALAFVAIEARAPAPLLRFSLLRQGCVAGASVFAFLVTGTFLPCLVLLSLYLQEVVGLTPLEAGLAFLPTTFVLMVFSGSVAARLIARLGQRSTALIALAGMAAGLVLLSLAAYDGAGQARVLAALTLLAAGSGTAFPLVMVAAAAGVAPAEQGMASGLVNTARQVGAAVGTAILVTLALSGAERLDDPAALADGLGRAFAMGAAVTVIAAIAALVMLGPARGAADR